MAELDRLVQKSKQDLALVQKEIDFTPEELMDISKKRAEAGELCREMLGQYKFVNLLRSMFREDFPRRAWRFTE